MKDDFVYLKHTLEAIEKIEKYLNDVDYKTFCKNDMLMDAVVRELEIIGEATSNLSEKFRRDNQEIPFRDIIDMRNFLIHEYFGVNKKIVWETCQSDLKNLKHSIRNILF